MNEEILETPQLGIIYREVQAPILFVLYNTIYADNLSSLGAYSKISPG